MKKAMSLILAMALVVSLFVMSTVSVSAIDVPQSQVIVGSGIPNAGNLSYKNGNYEMNVVLASPSTTTVQRNSNVLDIVDTNYRHNIKSQIKYSADAGTGKLSFAFDASFRGVANGMTLKVYDKSMTAYNSGYALVWSSEQHKLKATGNEAYNTSNAKTYTFKFDIDLATGVYAGTVNGSTLNDVGAGTKSFADFAQRGIGMVEFIVNTGRDTSNTGVVLRGASVSDGNGTVIASGIPASAVNEYTDGDYKFGITCDYSYNCKPILTTDSAVKITDSDKEHKIVSKIQYPVDSSDGTVIYEMNVTYIGNPGWRTSYNVYDKDGVAIGTYQVVNASSPNRYQHNSYPYVSTSGTDKLIYEVNTATGAFKFSVITPSGTYVLKEGVVNTANGIGAVEYAYESGTTAGAGIVIRGASVKCTPNPVIADHATLIDDIPNDFGTYNGVKISGGRTGTATVSIENNKIVMQNATNSSNFARLNFEKQISSADNGRSVYVEIKLTSPVKLDGSTTLKFNAKDSTGNWPITGGAIVNGSNPIEANTEYTFGIWLDFSSLNRYVIYKNGSYFGEAKLSGNSGVNNIYLEYYTAAGTALTINDISYTVIEPHNYDVETNTYFDTDVMLLNGIFHPGKVTSWTFNGIKFEALSGGKVTKEKISMCDGIRFVGSNKDKADGDDYARAVMYPDASLTKYPDGVIHALWDFTIDGNDDQTIAFASRGDGSWALNHPMDIDAGNHIAELIYNPATNMYKCIMDGTTKVIAKHKLSSIADIMLEWHGVSEEDVLTINNVRLMNVKEADFDTYGDIVIADDMLSASINIIKSEKYSFISKNPTFIIAAYKGDELVGINSIKADLKSGNNNVEVSLETLNGGTSVKAFLWDSIDGIRPVIKNSVK